MIVYRPASPLGLFVERMWWNDRPNASTTSESMLPTGTVQLVIALHDRPISWSPHPGAQWQHWTGGMIHGPQSTSFVSGPKPRGCVMGAAFRPGAASAVLGMPVNSIAGRHVTIDELWGARGRQLCENLAAAATPQAAFALLEEALTARVRAPLLIHPAIARALQPTDATVPHETRVTELQRESGYSAKHFIAMFRSAVGLTPKAYLRVQRFGRALHRLAQANPGRTLAEVAADAGYADQPHMTREFREFAGITPAEYRPFSATSAHHHVLTAPFQALRR